MDRTDSKIDTSVTQPRSVFDLKTTRRGLIALRNAHGADTPIGHRCSNLVELLQMPELATGLIQRQMADLERLRRTFQ